MVKGILDSSQPKIATESELPVSNVDSDNGIVRLTSSVKSSFKNSLNSTLDKFAAAFDTGEILEVGATGTRDQKSENLNSISRSITSSMAKPFTELSTEASKTELSVKEGFQPLSQPLSIPVPLSDWDWSLPKQDDGAVQYRLQQPPLQQPPLQQPSLQQPSLQQPSLQQPPSVVSSILNYQHDKQTMMSGRILWDESEEAEYLSLEDSIKGAEIKVSVPLR